MRSLEEMRVTEAYWMACPKADFVDALQHAMANQGMNQAELAARLGCSTAWVSSVLRGGPNITLRTMMKFARVLGFRVRIVLEKADANT